MSENAPAFLARIKSATERSDDLPGFIRNLEQEGLRVRPFIQGRGKWNGLRIVMGDLATSPMRLSAHIPKYAEIRASYDRRRDTEMLRNIAQAFDRDFGEVKEQNFTVLSSRDFQDAIMNADMEQARRDVPAIDPEVSEAIAEVNANPMSLNARDYARLQSGYDGWSRAPIRLVEHVSNDAIDGNQEIAATVEGLPPSKGSSVRRWICRGLEPEQALAMIATRTLAANSMITQGLASFIQQRTGKIIDRFHIMREASDPVTDPAVAQQVAIINETNPSLDHQHYAELRFGSDDWSRAPSRRIAMVAHAAVKDRPVVEDALMELDQQARKAALRWLCRGLAPEHVVCMTAARQELYGNPVPERLRDLASKYSCPTPSPSME